MSFFVCVITLFALLFGGKMAIQEKKMPINELEQVHIYITI